jgi:hypothetical protein
VLVSGRGSCQTLLGRGLGACTCISGKAFLSVDLRVISLMPPSTDI